KTIVVLLITHQFLKALLLHDMCARKCAADEGQGFTAVRLAEAARPSAVKNIDIFWEDGELITPRTDRHRREWQDGVRRASGKQIFLEIDIEISAGFESTKYRGG